MILVIMICPIMLVNTFLDTRLAVGLLGNIRGKGRVRPTSKKNEHGCWPLIKRKDLLATAIGGIIRRSKYKNCEGVEQENRLL